MNKTQIKLIHAWHYAFLILAALTGVGLGISIYDASWDQTAGDFFGGFIGGIAVWLPVIAVTSVMRRSTAKEGEPLVAKQDSFLSY